jgi:hypothetical protein
MSYPTKLIYADILVGLATCISVVVLAEILF